MLTNLIEQLASAKQIASEFVDAWGQPAKVPLESKRAMLAAMGYRVDDEAALGAQLDAEWRQHWQTPLDPVRVLRSGEALTLELRLPIEQVNDELAWTLALEGAAPLSGTVLPVDGEMVGVAHFDELEYQAYQVTLAALPPLGYHSLSLSRQGSQVALACMQIIVSPGSCYQPPAVAEGRKLWGPSIQLYCLRSQRNWGIGDFTDLSRLVEQMAHWGADFVGLNPIHALYPANPEAASPYSPSSRRWLNIAYIDVEATPEFRSNAAVQAEVAAVDFQQRLAALRTLEYVDYSQVIQTKLAVLQRLFDAAALDAHSARGVAFAEFIREGGDSLRQQAIFDALQAHLYAQGQNAWGWPAWPEPLRHYQGEAVGQWAQEHEADIRFYMYLQWLAAEQLQAADAQARQAGMLLGLYRDLAVGVSEGSAEIWANHDSYCVQASIGAPPDVLGPRGQNWGLPPLDPSRLRAQAYAPFIELLRANMRACGALRIDHALGLLRLWWVPPGAPASQGAYIYYPVDELLAILALESVRNQCLVIGEDLGTIPEGMDVLLKEGGIYSYKVFFFERDHQHGGFKSPRDYPAQAMAALTTHDMPTLRGYWHCEDLQLVRELGLSPDEQALQAQYRERHENKQQVLNSLRAHELLPPSVGQDVSWVGMSTELSQALQVHLCLGNSALYSTQLEDWLDMDKPVNIPGTSTEYPNWRRKLSRELETMFSDASLEGLAGQMTRARRQAGQ